MRRRSQSTPRVSHASVGPRRRSAAVLRSMLAVVLAAIALYPAASRWRAARDERARVERLASAVAGGRQLNGDLDQQLSLRVQQLGPLLASWETVGGCGAGSSGGAGTVKWIGRSTTGGLFQDITQLNYIHLDNAYNLIASTQ